MLEYLDRKIGFATLIWASPAVFLVHDLEEVLTMERFWRENRDRLPIPDALKNRIEATTEEMAAAVACVTAAGYLSSYLAAGSPGGDAKMRLFDAVAAVRFVNALAHLLQTLALRSYAPGSVTALVVSLPASLYVFHRLRAEGLVAKRPFSRWLLDGVLLHGPAVFGAQVAGRALAKRL